MQKIKNEDITFVVQGPFVEGTQGCIDSIKFFFPSASIILSVWVGDDIAQAECDAVLKNIDPGGLDCGPEKWFNNINRMIVSTRNGMNEVSTKYSVKVRSDYYFMSNNFLNIYYEMYNSNLHNTSWFKQPVLIDYSYVTLGLPYFMNDWFQFGLTTDLVNLWNIPLATQEDAEYFKYKKDKNSIFKFLYYPVKNMWARYHSEQYLLCMYLQKNKLPCSYSHQQDAVSIMGFIKNSIEMADNFFFISRRDIGIISSKYGAYFDSKVTKTWYDLHSLKTKKISFFHINRMCRILINAFRITLKSKVFGRILINNFKIMLKSKVFISRK